MPTILLTNEQVVELIKQLPVEDKRTILETLTGRNPNTKQITKLGASANLGATITKVNEIIDRLRG